MHMRFYFQSCFAKVLGKLGRLEMSSPALLKKVGGVRSGKEENTSLIRSGVRVRGRELLPAPERVAELSPSARFIRGEEEKFVPGQCLCLEAQDVLINSPALRPGHS